MNVKLNVLIGWNEEMHEFDLPHVYVWWNVTICLNENACLMNYVGIFIWLITCVYVNESLYMCLKWEGMGEIVHACVLKLLYFYWKAEVL